MQIQMVSSEVFNLAVKPISPQQINTETFVRMPTTPVRPTFLYFPFSGCRKNYIRHLSSQCDQHSSGAPSSSTLELRVQAPSIREHRTAAEGSYVHHSWRGRKLVTAWCTFLLVVIIIFIHRNNLITSKGRNCHKH